jgi:glycosyltransferase involved in cell wall biosynthesis
VRLRARRAAKHLQDADVVLAANHPCSTMLGQVKTAARRIWQCNEPPRRIHLRGANPFLAARVDATGGKGIEDACAPFARRLAGPASETAAFDVESVSRLDRIFAISAFSRDNTRGIYGRCGDEVVPPIVRFPGAVSPRAGLDRSGLQVLAHTRLEVPKNVDTLLRGFARFRAATCPGARIHLVGDGPHRPRLEALAAELGLADVARFHGFLPESELRAVYAACDVFALLPLDEPFGMVFPEAAAQGLLLVGPDHGGPVEILEGGELGFLCNAFDPDALADALARIWALDDAEVDRRRVAADRACRARYAAEEVGPRLLRALG